MTRGLFGFPFGVPIRTDASLTELVQHSRSPSRARRRAKQGHRQHHSIQPMRKAFKAPDGALIMHPALLDGLLASLKAGVAGLPGDWTDA